MRQSSSRSSLTFAVGKHMEATPREFRKGLYSPLELFFRLARKSGDHIHPYKNPPDWRGNFSDL
jgi:hypothetical protein